MVIQTDLVSEARIQEYGVFFEDNNGEYEGK
jgi:hypothetical protein